MRQADMPTNRESFLNILKNRKKTETCSESLDFRNVNYQKNRNM